MDQQFTPSNPTQLVTSEQDHADCIMKSTNIYNNSSGKFYSCAECIDKNLKHADKICEICYNTCHRDHYQSEEIIEQILVIKEDVVCSCALQGHFKCNDDNDTNTSCYFQLIAQDLNIPKSVVIEEVSPTNVKKELCYACYLHCYSKFKDLKAEIVEDAEYKCSCKKCLNSKSPDEHLLKLLENYRKESLNCRSLFLGYFTTETNNTYVKQIVNVFERYRTGTSPSEIDETFSSSLKKFKLLKIGIKMFESTNKEVMNPRLLIDEYEKPDFDFFNKDNLDLKTTLGYKYYYMYYFRHLIIKRNIPTKYMFALLDSINNLLPYQRQLFRMTFDELYEKNENCIKIDFNFLIKIFTIDHMTILENHENIILFIVEYFKWCCFFTSIDSKSSQYITIIETAKILNAIIDGISKIHMAIKGKIKFSLQEDEKIQHYIKKLFKINLLRFNDDQFFKFIENNPAEDDNTQNQLKLFFQKVNKNDKLNGRLILFYAMFFSNQNKVQVDSVIYELLLSEHDIYIFGLQNLLKYHDYSYLSFLYKQMTTLLKNKYVSRKDNKYESPIVYDEELKCIKKNLDVNPNEIDHDEIIKCITDYYLGNNNDQENLDNFISTLTKILKSIKTKVTSEFNQDLKIMTQDTVMNRVMRQINHLKKPYFNLLFKIYFLLKEDGFIRYNIPKEMLNQIKGSILEIFSLYLTNPFILPYFFSRGAMKVLSSVDYNNLDNSNKIDLSFEEITFYKNALDICTLMKYPLDFYKLTTLMLSKHNDISSIHSFIKKQYSFAKEDLKDEDKQDEDIQDEGLQDKLEEHYKLLDLITLKLQTINNILQISSTYSLMPINSLLNSYLNTMNYAEILQLDYIQLSPKHKKFYLTILKAQNSLNDYYYLLLPKKQYFNAKYDEVITYLSDKISKEDNTQEGKELDKELCIFTSSLIRYRAISQYQVTPCTMKNLIAKPIDANLSHEVSERDSDSESEEKKKAEEEKEEKEEEKEEDKEEEEEKEEEKEKEEEEEADKEDDNEISLWKISDEIKFSTVEDTNDNIEKINDKMKEKGKLKQLGKKKGLMMNTLAKGVTQKFFQQNNLDRLFSILENFKVHIDAFIFDNEEVFNHFNEIIFKPTIYMIYDFIYFKELNSSVKFTIYKIINLFFQCYKYFIYTIKNKIVVSFDKRKPKDLLSMECMFGSLIKPTDNDQEANLEKFSSLLFKSFNIPNKRENLEIFFQNIHDCIEIDLQIIDRNALNTEKILEKLNKHTRLLKQAAFLPSILLKENIFFSFHSQHKVIQEDEEKNLSHIQQDVIQFELIIQAFIDRYIKMKLNKADNLVIESLNNNQEDNDMSDLLICDLLKKLQLKEKEDSFNEKFFSNFDYVNKIFVSAPQLFQFCIKNNRKHEKIINMIKRQLPLIYQYMIIDYHKLNDHSNDPLYSAIKIFTMLLEFLRLLCENHDPFFQDKLAYEFLEDDFLLIHLIIQIPGLTRKHFNKYTSRINKVKFFKKHDIDYFKPLIEKITAFNIELIQGSTAMEQLGISAEFEKNILNEYFQDYCTSASEALEATQDGMNEFYLSHFFKFIVCVMEEPNIQSLEKNAIGGIYNSNKLLAFCEKCMKKVYNALYDAEHLSKKKNEIDSEDLLNYYISNHNVFKKEEFNIASTIMKYFELVSILSTTSKIHQMMTNVHNKNFANYEKEKVEIFKFFNSIMKTIEVSLVFDAEDKSDSKVIKNVFFVHPDVLRLKTKDFRKFEENAPYEDKNKKLNYLLQYMPKFFSNITLKKATLKKSALFTMMKNMNYHGCVEISAFFSIIISLIVTFSSFHTKKTIPSGETIFVSVRSNKLWIYCLSSIHLIFLLGVMINWFYFRIHTLKELGSQKIEIGRLITKYVSDIQFLLFWNFFWGFIGMVFNQPYAFSFQLLVIFALFDTMKTVLISVQMRYKQFLSAGLLIVIFALFFASIKYYWFCDSASEVCTRFLYCFLDLMTNGIREGEGVGFEMKSINDPSYYSDFVLEWLFHFTMAIIMINVINAIIVDTFQEQRKINNDKLDAKKNCCYICNSQRAYFEKKGEDYEDHINDDHALMHYFQYLLTLTLMDPSDMNSVDSIIIDQSSKAQTGFFPPEKNLNEN